MIGADEYHEQVDDSVYTNVAARDALRIATQAAAITGHDADPQWAQVADRLRILFDPAKGLHPEFFNYQGDTIKQADVALLAYPWENPQPAAVTQADLDHYVPRTDPDGPSMTDAIHAILTLAARHARVRRVLVHQAQRRPVHARALRAVLRSPHRRVHVHHRRRRLPAGVPVRVLGLALACRPHPAGPEPAAAADGRHAAPSSGTGARCAWRSVAGPRPSRCCTAPRRSRCETPAGASTLQPGKSITMPTRRPDETPTDDVARCRAATVAPATAEPPQAAVDGTPATSWLAEEQGTRLQVDLGAAVPLGAVTITRPDVLAIATGKTDTDDHARTGPTRSAAETVAVSADGRTWQPLASPRRR